MERDKILNLDLSITGKSRNSKDKIEIFKYHNIDILGGFEYQKNITIGEFLDGIRDVIRSGRMSASDEISQLGYIEREYSGFMQMDDGLKTFWYFVIQVGRYTLETDEEYAARQQEIYKKQKEEEEKEKNLYLRLKAKYE